MDLSPIILFCYNRPEHTKRTLESLGKNVGAKESVVWVFSDGAKRGVERQVKCVREVVNSDWVKSLFKEVKIVERKENYGLAKNVIEGVSEVIKDAGRVIVLEDDLLTSSYFLKYMNGALEYYAERKGVFSIAANRPPENRLRVPVDYKYDVFVSLRNFSTGWATWKDRWEQVDWSLDYMNDLLKNEEMKKAFNRAGEDMTDMLCLQRDGKIDSWAIRFSFAHFKEHAVAILPCKSYVDNIGFDNTGVHSGKEYNGEHRNDLSKAVENPKWVDVLYEDRRIVNRFYNVYSRRKRIWWKRVVRMLLRKFGWKDLPFEIKEKVFV